VPLFWLRYRHPDGRFAGVVVLKSDTLIRARMKAAGSEAVQGLDFVGAHQLDKASARQIPADMIGRLIHDGDLRKLQQAITPTKPAAPSVQRRPAAKRSMRRQ
jgi:hypothetical protein